MSAVSEQGEQHTATAVVARVATKASSGTARMQSTSRTQPDADTSARTLGRTSAGTSTRTLAHGSSQTLKYAPKVAAPSARLTQPFPKQLKQLEQPERLPSVSNELALDELLEQLHDLRFARDASEASAFVVDLACQKLRCGMGIVQLYDVDSREFVVEYAVGPSANRAIANKMPDDDPFIAEIVAECEPVVVDGGDRRVRRGRWINLGGFPRSVLVCPVVYDGSVSGILEFGRSDPRMPFVESDIEAVRCVAREFAEYLFNFTGRSSFNSKHTLW